MVKSPQKASKTQTNTINSVLAENKPVSKSRQQINQENYQKNKTKLKTRQKERYQQQKKQAQLTTQQYYQANSIRILMSLKEYTELNKDLDIAECYDIPAHEWNKILKIIKEKQEFFISKYHELNK